MARGGPSSRRLRIARLASPPGDIEVAYAGSTVVWCGFVGAPGDIDRDRYLSRAFPGSTASRTDALDGRLAGRFAAYLGGDVAALDAIDVELVGTPFERRVWEAMRKIPAGRTSTYGAIARAIGRPTAFRAVGGAIHRNPVGIVVPCHRVIGSGGALTGYAGGLARKRWLLAHEGAGQTLPLAGLTSA